MRVKMLRPMFNAQYGNHHPGAIVDLPDEEAASRIAAGYCAPADEEPKRGLLDRLRRRGGDGQDPKEEDPSGGEKTVPVDKMTIPQLEAYAAEHEIDLGGATLKRDILAAIEAAQDED